MCKSILIQFVNCKILRAGKIQNEDFWIRDGKIIDPEKIFFDEKIPADVVIDCKDSIISPGFIELQINGGFGIDFSYNSENVENGVNKIAKCLLAHGITSFCPTIVTSPVEIYHKILPKIKKRQGDKNGATILGLHLEGPFINVEKKGAHPLNCIQPLSKGFNTLLETYGSLDNVSIITLAPELENSIEVIKELRKRNITVSLGHSMANLTDGEVAVNHGASFITHLFNAMLPFHHRDPGLVGLLASKNICEKQGIFYGIIADGVHTHPSALRLAYRTNPKGLVIVTDAISALGLKEGSHHIGQLAVQIINKKAYVAGTNTLCGSIASMNECVQILYNSIGCSKEYALECATLHPAQTLKIESQKGTLNFGADADFLLLDNDLNVCSTWINGKCVYQCKDQVQFEIVKNNGGCNCEIE